MKTVKKPLNCSQDSHTNDQRLVKLKSYLVQKSSAFQCQLRLIKYRLFSIYTSTTADLWLYIMIKWKQVNTFQERKDNHFFFLSHIKFIRTYKHYIMITQLKALWAEKMNLGNKQCTRHDFHSAKKKKKTFKQIYCLFFSPS